MGPFERLVESKLEETGFLRKRAAKKDIKNLDAAGRRLARKMLRSDPRNRYHAPSIKQAGKSFAKGFTQAERERL